jgi:hypothetical protein
MRTIHFFLTITCFFIFSCAENKCGPVKFRIKNLADKNIDSLYIQAGPHSNDVFAEKISLSKIKEFVYEVDMSKAKGEGEFKIGYWLSNDTTHHCQYFGYYTNGCYENNSFVVNLSISDTGVVLH